MPRYDFKCNSCRTGFTLSYQSFGAYASAEQHRCPACKSDDTSRKIGRVAVTKGAQGRLDALSDPTALASIDESDPNAVGRFMKQMGQELGSNVDTQIDETLDNLKK